MEKRRIGLVIAGLLMLAIAVRHPSADIRIETHELTDRAPQRVSAAIDLGLVGVSFLYTWSKRLTS